MKTLSNLFTLRLNSNLSTNFENFNDDAQEYIPLSIIAASLWLWIAFYTASMIS